MHPKWFFLIGAGVLLPTAAFAQEADSTALTVQRIFGTREFSPGRVGEVRWLDDGDSYTTVERSVSVKGGRDIVRYETATGARSLLVPAERLCPAGDSTALNPENYEWSPDRKLLLLYTNSKRVWRVRSRGDYWVLRLADWTLWKVGGDAKPSTLMFAKFSPAGDKLGYVCGGNLYVQNIQTREITALTGDGSQTSINGTFDWVYEEEFGIRDGFRWSPDGQHIAYWHLDATGVRDFYLINNTDSLYPFITPIPYPKVGETLSACRIGVVSVAGGQTLWMNVPGDPRDNYIPRMDWAGNSNEIAFQYLNRRQNRNRLMIGDRRTGEVRAILTDSDSAWVEVVDSMKWVNGGRAFLWLSERDGWNHLFLHDRSGAMIANLTPGPFDVLSVDRVDARGQWVYLSASPENPTRRSLYRVSLKGGGAVERCTPPDQNGWHTYDIAPNGAWAFHTFSAFGTPPSVELVRLPDHAVVRTVVSGKAARRSVDRLKRGASSFFRVDIGGGVLLDGWKMLPPDFDSTRTYPLIVYVYGEPAAQTVLDRWGGDTYLWHLLLTQRGYIVVSVDNRGTPAPRGRAWRKCIYRQIGILASEDQAAAVRAMRRWPFVDSTRIGVWGWSGGGSMTLNGLFRYPELYQTGIAVAFVSDQRLYDAIYQERYMGLLPDNERGYRDGSPITHAGGLRGNLLLVHGTGDDNVHYQSAERLINALVKEKKQFSMMSYPNRTHGISEGENTTIHLYTLFSRYFDEHLPPGAR